MEPSYDPGMAASTLADEELAVAAAAGDETAFAQLYERYATPLYDFACRLLRNRADAGDAVQVTMERAWRNLGTRRPDAKFKSWLFTIVHHAAMDVIRRRRPTETIDDERDEGYAVIDDVADIGTRIESQELADDLWAAAAALSPIEYSALHHELRGGLDADEIAEVMGMRRGAVYTAQSRARDSLGEAFAILRLGRAGREECPELDRLLASHTLEQLDRKVRRAVRAHLDECETCSENTRRLVAPSELFSKIPPIPAPEELVDIASIVRSGRGEAQAPSRAPGRLEGRDLRALAVGAVVATITAMLVAILALTGGDDPGGADEPGSQALVADGTAPFDPTDVTSISHTVGEASTEDVVVMTWSPGRDPEVDGEASSGLGGYSHEWTGSPDSLPSDDPALPADASGTESPRLEAGRWWFHLRTFDAAGNSTQTVHLGPFVIVDSLAVRCKGTSDHPYWIQNPVVARMVFEDGDVRIQISSTPEGTGYLRDSAASGRLSVEALVSGEVRIISLQTRRDRIGAEVQAGELVIHALHEGRRAFIDFARCTVPG